MAQQAAVQQPEQNANVIAIDTKLFKDTVNLDCRLEDYKAAFPEMNRSNPPARPHGSMDRIWIKYEKPCSKLIDLDSPPVPCTANQPGCCMGCEHRSFHKLEAMLKSNFARGSGLRQELLPFYFQLVQFEWSQQACERGETRTFMLDNFFAMSAASRLNKEFKHLTIHFPWKYTGFKAPEWSADGSFRSDAVGLGGVMAVLHKYRIKAELTFLRTRAVRLPFVKRIEELCKANLRCDGPAFWQQVVAQEESIFRFDADLRKSAVEVVRIEEANREE